MGKFTKITVGFVTQTYENNITGKFICTDQEFIAGDQVDYEDIDSNTIVPPEHEYQSFAMPIFTGIGIRAGNQVDIGDVKIMRQARDVIGKYENIVSQSGKPLIECFVSEQCSDAMHKKIRVNIIVESDKLWIQPVGYGDKTSADGHGWPIGIEIWQGSLRLIVFDNIKCEDPQIIDLENAKESNRSDTTD